MTATETAPQTDAAPEPGTNRVVFTAPTRGHFFARIAMPLDTPLFLEGKRGVKCWRIQTLGDHSHIYALEGFGDLLDGLIDEGGKTKRVELDLREGRDETAGAAFWAHPAVSDDWSELLPVATVDGEEVVGADVKLVNDGNVLKRVRVDLRTQNYGVRLWFDLMARSPVVEACGLVRRFDGQSRRGVRVRLEFGEPALRRRQLTDPLPSKRIELVSDIDTVEFAPLRFVLLCETSGLEQLQERQEDPEALDVMTLEALEAGLSGPFFGKPVEWRGDWLLSPVVQAPIAKREAHELLGDHRASWIPTQRRRHASPDHPHAAGNNAAYGVTYSAHWSIDDPQIVPALLWNAEDWMRRPVHYCEPGTVADPVKYRDDLWTKSRVPYEGRGPNAFHHNKLGLRKLPGKSYIRGRKGHDDQHFADMPLLAAYAMTGDPLCEHTMRSHLAMDLHQIQTRLGTSGNGRAEGRVGINMLVAGVLLGGSDQVEVFDHLVSRMERARGRQDELGGPLGLAYNRSNCDLPARTPYEDAQAAFALWSLYRLGIVDSRIVFAPSNVAFTAAEVVVDALYFEDGRPWVPYRVSDDALEVEDELSHDSAKVHPGDWLWWSAIAFPVFLDLAAADDPRREKVEQALRWMRTAEPRRLSDFHLGGVVLA